MDAQQFMDGLKDPEQKVEEWAAAAEFFTGIKKQAYSYGACMPPSMDNPQKGWLGQFEGSPLFEQAIALERQELTMEAEDLAQRQQDRAQSEGRIQADQQRWDSRDQIRLEKKKLELTLAEQQAGSSGADISPKPEAGIAMAGAAPAPDAPTSPAPNTSMPKLAKLHPITRSALSGAAIGGVLGGTGGALNAQEGHRARDTARGVHSGAVSGGLLGSLVGAARSLKPTGDFVSRAWPKPKPPSNGGGTLKQAMKKLGYTIEPTRKKTASFAQVAEALRMAIPSHGVSDPIRSALTVGAAGIGAGLAFNKFRSREQLKGRSKAEVEAEKDLKLQKGDEVDESEMGLPGKLKRRMTEAGPGVSKVLREHPVLTTAGGAYLGSRLGASASKALGIGADALRYYKTMRG